MCRCCCTSAWTRWPSSPTASMWTARWAGRVTRWRSSKRLTTGRLIGIDRDETAIAAAQERLADYGDRVTLVHSNFDRIGDILADLHIDGADGMLFDLGVSSPQLDDAERGFSYMHDAPLDMRMDRDGVSHRPGGGEQLEL